MVVVKVDQCEVFFECRLLEVVLHGRGQHSIPPQVEADVLQEWRDSTNT